MLALLGLAVLNPERFVAEHNVARWAETGRIDQTTSSRLSADAVPALLDLPEPMRSCTLAPIPVARRARRLAQRQPRPRRGPRRPGRRPAVRAIQSDRTPACGGLMAHRASLSPAPTRAAGRWCCGRPGAAG